MIASVQALWLSSQIRAVFCASALFLGHGTVRAQDSEGSQGSEGAGSQAGEPSPDASPSPSPSAPESVPAVETGEPNKAVYPRAYTYPQAARPQATGPRGPRASETQPKPGTGQQPSPYRPRVPREADLPDESDLDARRHRGFFLRLSSGIGAGGSRYHAPVHGELQSVKTRGLSTMFEFSMGGALTENLILHGNAAFLNVYESRREVSGRHENSPDIESGCALLGAGLTYYLMPANTYITVTSGVAGFSESRRGRLTIESRAGVGGSLSLGKEWWIGRTGDWGVGAALRGSFYTMKAHIYGDLERVYVSDIGLVFSATMN